MVEAPSPGWACRAICSRAALATVGMACSGKAKVELALISQRT
jgi:hypothetical protein